MELNIQSMYNPYSDCSLECPPKNIIPDDGKTSRAVFVIDPVVKDPLRRGHVRPHFRPRLVIKLTSVEEFSASRRVRRVRAKDVVVADEGRVGYFRKVWIIPEALEFGFVQHGPEEAKFEQGID